MKKLIKNVTQLDMRNATEEAIEGLTIKNASSVLVSPSTKHLLSKVNFKNITHVAEVPEDVNVSLINGVYTMDGSENAESTYLICNGILTFKPSMTAEIFNRSFCGGVINGMAYVPDSLTSAFALFDVNGMMHTYPANSQVYQQTLVINSGFLQGLSEKTSITALKGITIEADNLDTIETLTVFGKTIVPERLKDAFYKVAKRYDEVIVVPEGYTLYDERLEIRPTNQLSFRGKSIYTTENVYLFEGIEQLDFKLITEGTVIAPDKIVMSLADRIEARGMFYTYQGDINVVTGVQTYTNVPGNYLIMPHAELIIQEDADLAAIDHIYLQGGIAVSEESQIMALNAKLVLNEGAIFHNQDENFEDKDEDLDEYDIVLGNASSYTL